MSTERNHRKFLMLKIGTKIKFHRSSHRDFDMIGFVCKMKHETELVWVKYTNGSIIAEWPDCISIYTDDPKYFRVGYMVTNRIKEKSGVIVNRDLKNRKVLVDYGDHLCGVCTIFDCEKCKIDNGVWEDESDLWRWYYDDDEDRQ